MHAQLCTEMSQSQRDDMSCVVLHCYGVMTAKVTEFLFFFEDLVFPAFVLVLI